MALMDGELDDKESGLPHMGHIQCNAMFYNYCLQRGKLYSHNPSKND